MDVFVSFSDWSSGQPLDLDAIVTEVEGRSRKARTTSSSAADVSFSRSRPRRAGGPRKMRTPRSAADVIFP